MMAYLHKTIEVLDKALKVLEFLQTALWAILAGLRLVEEKVPEAQGLLN